jgi:hypothetical protein
MAEKYLFAVRQQDRSHIPPHVQPRSRSLLWHKDLGQNRSEIDDKVVAHNPNAIDLSHQNQESQQSSLEIEIVNNLPTQTLHIGGVLPLALRNDNRYKC